jgi:hypothetical protein
MADAIGKKCADINRLGIPVWLRFAHEMKRVLRRLYDDREAHCCYSGGWYAYGEDPQGFVATWQTVPT